LERLEAPVGRLVLVDAGVVGVLATLDRGPAGAAEAVAVGGVVAFSNVTPASPMSLLVRGMKSS
jgi:hypothetical protein